LQTINVTSAEVSSTSPQAGQEALIVVTAGPFGGSQVPPCFGDNPVFVAGPDFLEPRPGPSRMLRTD
jgi:hypothetical protein